MHILRLLERRFPQHKGNLPDLLMLISVSLLIVGLALMFIR